jgi:hypothetical protein
MRSLLGGFLGAAIASTAVAQDQNAGAKLLTPEQCAEITKVAEGEFHVKGPIKFGGTTMEDITIQRKSIGMGDVLDAINRSCFNEDGSNFSPGLRKANK